jgi:hypothetical protein
LSIQTNVWGDDNPFIGKWILESDTRITRIFTSTTRTNYFNGIANPTPGSIGSTKYTYDSEKIYFTDIQSTPYGNIENNWSSEYSFIDGKLNLGGQLHFRDPVEVAKREQETTRREQEATEANARREREATEAAVIREREATEVAARKEQEIAEEASYANKIFAGLSYSYPLTFGINSGAMITNRIGIYIGIDYTVENLENYKKGTWNYSSDSYDRPKISVNGIIYNNNFENTNSALSFIGGLNIMIISPLCISAGIGINIPNKVYQLYTRDSISNEYEPEWVEIDFKKDNSIIFEAGLLYAFKYLYITGKYRYIDNSSTFCIGAGLVLSKKLFF